MNKKTAILTLLGFIPFKILAFTQDSLRVVVDSSLVSQRSFSEKLSEKYTGNEFDYDTMDGEAENFIFRAIRWFFRKIGDFFGFDVSPEMIKFLELFFYTLIGILAVYIIIKLLVGDSPSSFFTKKSTQLAPLNIQEEHIENIDLDALIKEALKQGNYRLAIRYMYLKSLKELSQKNLIDWHYDKTNTDYYTEIKDGTLKKAYKQTSYLYDNIWYGEFELDTAGFDIAKKDFEHLTKQINHVR
ncbi:hypothetical protein [Patiriisocius hiemis]|uniref:DUF4129 domain-containing protein n=1 Tax=Patiriisocius hiemis TaxID=3075604 RepID=A0ABU2YFD4_9FLAO|nr:hypothetical protein [Constantimarinum sp. W242]MDT0556586.1 hypothetical protein [Constantimarinum sp. W242]